MKHKKLIIATVIFFLIVNTNYFWENELGLTDFPIVIFWYFFVFVLFIVLVFNLFRQFNFSIKEKYTDKKRLVLISFLASVLALAVFFPRGIINFEGKDLLVAQREGAANCMTTFKIKKNNKFIANEACFGISEIKGNYRVYKDTLFFSFLTVGNHDKDYYAFAVFKKTETQNKEALGELVFYKSNSDTIGLPLLIIKNELNE